MNIRDFWPDSRELPTPTADSVDILLEMRRQTYRGFCKLESVKGFLHPEVDLSTTQGQEMARILMFRCLEEFTESIDSQDPDHILEELIDSLNYLWSLAIMDSHTRFHWHPLNILHWQPSATRHTRPVGFEQPYLALGELSAALGRVTDTFRNRAWMANPQDVYFAGYVPLRECLEWATRHILQAFSSWETFWSYYVAKDRVLKFRLRSSY